MAAIQALEPSGVIADLFCGTSRVAHALKAAGYYVKANDHTTFAYCLARCYVATDRDRVIGRAERVLAELRRVTPRPGVFTETYCIHSRFFHPKNGALVDAVDALPAADSDRPTVVIGQTVKGNGIGFMEHTTTWHSGQIDDETLERCYAELAERYAGVEVLS